MDLDLQQMKIFKFTIILFIFYNLLIMKLGYSAWWESEIQTPLSVYKNNSYSIDTKTKDISIIDNFVFSLVKSPVNQIRSDKSWGKLELDAKSLILSYYINKKIADFSIEEKLLYETFFHFKNMGNIKKGMVVNTKKDSENAILIYGVDLDNVSVDIPSIEFITDFIKKSVMSHSVKNPCQFRYLFNQNEMTYFDNEFICEKNNETLK